MTTDPTFTRGLRWRALAAMFLALAVSAAVTGCRTSTQNVMTYADQLPRPQLIVVYDFTSVPGEVQLDSGVEVLFCDMPEVSGAMGRFILTSMANVAELEAGLVSERTKAALSRAKARGVKLGRTGAEILAPKFRAEAKARAEQFSPILHELRHRGLTLRAIARELTKRRLPTPRGGKWHPQLVARLLERVDAVA